MRKNFNLSSFIVVLIGIFYMTQMAMAGPILIEADKQSFQVAKNSALFTGNVRLNYGNIKITSAKATLNSDPKGQPQKATFTQNVSAVKTTKESVDQLTANSLTLMVASNTMVAEGNTYSQIKKNSPNVITIKANKQELNNATNAMKANGNVTITYKGMTITGDAIDLSTLAGKPSKAIITGNAKVVRPSSTINANAISLDFNSHNIEANGAVNTLATISEGNNVTMQSDFQQFDKASSTIIGSGHVKVVYQDYLAEGPKAIIALENGELQKVIFSGGAQIKDSQRLVNANLITVTLNPKNFTAEGNVKTQLLKQGLPEPNKESTKVEKPANDSTQTPSNEPETPPAKGMFEDI